MEQPWGRLFLSVVIAEIVMQHVEYCALVTNDTAFVTLRLRHLSFTAVHKTKSTIFRTPKSSLQKRSKKLENFLF